MAAGVDSNGLEFYGTKGRLFITRAGFEFTPADPNGPAGYGSGRGRGMAGRGTPPPFPPEPVKNPNAIAVRASGGDQHLQNFLDCVKSRKPPNASLLDGLRAAQACHLCSVSYQQGRKLKFDTRHEKLVG
jgi:predicted dehydrogenase